MALYARFDCSFSDDPKVAAAGDLAELVYFRCVLKCRENLTDGVIDRRLLPRWTAGIRGKANAHAQALVDVGLWLEHPDGWRIPEAVWRRWNPTAAEVAEKRRLEAERKQAYRESKPRPNGTLTNVPLGHPAESKRRDAQPKPEPELIPATGSRGQLWTAMSQRFGEPATDAEKKNRGRQVKELHAVNATPDDIEARCNEHASRRLSWSLTANALVTHWTDLTPRQSAAHILNGARVSPFMQG